MQKYRKTHSRGFGLVGVMLPVVLGTLLLGLQSPCAAEEEYSKEQQLVEKAKLTLEQFMASSDLELFQNQLKKARAVLILPQVIKGALWFGGAGGSGVLMVRDEEKGSWSDPAFYSLGAGSFGLQIGGSVTQMILLVMKTKGVESFYTTSFKLGADGTIALGPVGIGTQGSTTLTTHFPPLQFSESNQINKLMEES